MCLSVYRGVALIEAGIELAFGVLIFGAICIVAVVVAAAISDVYIRSKEERK
jgi:hypothetical protein